MSLKQSAANKVVLTLEPLTKKEDQDLLIRVTDGEYSTMLPADVKSTEDSSRVEIILLDTGNREQLSFLSNSRLATFPNLKLIQSTRAGLDALDYEEIPPQVLVCGNVGAYGDQMAEHVFAMILYFARNLEGSDESLARGEWKIPRRSVFLRGKTILVIGAGGIGTSVGRIASALGMRTVGVRTTGRPVEYFEQVVPFDKLDEVLKDADVIVLSLPLTVKTFQLIDEAKLAAMKSNCILINVARGYIIKEGALFEHLKNNPDFKCGLDVWWHYPKPGGQFAQRYPFFELPNFLGTPHDSGIVPETDEITIKSSIENIRRFARGEPLKGLMNRDDYIGLKGLLTQVD